MKQQLRKILDKWIRIHKEKCKGCDWEVEEAEQEILKWHEQFLPSVDELIKILNTKFGMDYLRDIHTGEPIDMSSEIIEVAKAIHSRLRGKRRL